jgi:U3 small nucleolar RNA-associated protein 4
VNLLSSALSPDGRWVACSDALNLKLFRLAPGGADGALAVDKVSLAATRTRPAASLAFSDDSQLLVVGGVSGYVQLLDLATLTVVRELAEHAGGTAPIAVDEEEEEEEEEEGKEEGKGGAASQAKTGRRKRGEASADAQARNAAPTAALPPADGRRGCVVLVAVSADGQWLASGDDLGRVHIYSMRRGAAAAARHHFAMPSSEAPLTALAFAPGATQPTLVVTAAPGQVRVVDVATRRVRMLGALPRTFVGKRDVVAGVLFDAARPDTALLHSHNGLCRVPLAEAHVGNASAAAAEKPQRKKRGREAAEEDERAAKLARPEQSQSSTAAAAAVSDRYRSLLGAQTTLRNGGELVVVEVPWVRVLEALPLAVKRRIFGT